MSKQDIIREEIAEHIYTLHIRRSGWDEWYKLSKESRDSYISSLAMPIIRKLHSKGVVLKVEREKVEGCDIIPKTNAICPYKEDCYALTEPLI